MRCNLSEKEMKEQDEEKSLNQNLQSREFNYHKFSAIQPPKRKPGRRKALKSMKSDKTLPTESS